MKIYIFVFVVIILVLGAGIVIAAPVNQDGVAYPQPPTATINAYPIVWPTVTPEATATAVPLPTSKPDKTRPTKTPPPIPQSIDGLPYIPE